MNMYRVRNKQTNNWVSGPLPIYQAQGLKNRLEIMNPDNLDKYELVPVNEKGKEVPLSENF